MSNSIKKIPKEERPRERFIKYGQEYLKTEELISIILNNGTKGSSVLDISNNVLNEIDNISDFKNLTINKLKKINGIGQANAIKLLAALELGKRVYYHKNIDKVKLNNSTKIYNYIKDDLIDKKQELFYALYLDNKKNLIEKKLLFIGTINKSIVHPRKIFKYAYLLSASSIVCIHNHPSGDSFPSNEDIELTNALVEIGKIQGIKIIDHIIIGKNYYSFYENGYI